MLISAKEIISRSLDIFKKDIRLWTPYVMLTFLFSLLSLIFTFGTFLWGFLLNAGLSVVVIFTLTVLILIVLVVMGMWINIGLVQVVQKRILDQQPKHFKEELSQAKHFIARSIGISLLVAVVAALPIILSLVGYAVTGFVQLAYGLKGAAVLYMFFGFLGIYGVLHMIYFSIKFSFSYYAVILDAKPLRESLHISSHLVKGRVLSVFWRLMAPVFVFVLIYILINYIFTAIALVIGGNIALLGANIISLALSAFISPLTVLATVLLFEDLKAKPMPVEAAKVK